jgi:hypothetical protein
LITTTSNSKINKNEISESLKCAGIFTATQFIKQDELPNGDLAYKENSLAAAKVTRDFLSSEGVSDEKINSGINSTVDEMFGKPYQKTLIDNCYGFIFELVPNGKEKIEETARTIYGG